MSIQVKTEDNEVEKLIQALFIDAGFCGFTFHTSFILRFCHNNKVEYKGRSLPNEIELNIGADWWFGPKDEWKSRVEKFSLDEVSVEPVEPDEPVLAYELASLRWSEGSQVESVYFKDDTMIILFRCGKSISILCESEMDYSWVVSAYNNKNVDEEWSVICEDGELFMRIPE